MNPRTYPRWTRLAALNALVLLAALVPWRGSAQFTFADPPPLYSAAGAVSADCPSDFPLDTFSDYTEYDNLNGLNGGCTWDAAYVAGNSEIPPFTIARDDFERYTTSASLAGLNYGLGWDAAYSE